MSPPRVVSMTARYQTFGRTGLSSGSRFTPAARAVLHSVIRTPGPRPYTKSRAALLRHFGRTPRQLARDLRDGNRSIGEKLPSEFLDHVRGLVQDFSVFLEVVLLDALPANARDAALAQSDLESMAAAADQVVLENRAAASSLRDGAINSLGVLPAESSPSSVLYPDLSSPELSPAPANIAAVSRGHRQQPQQQQFHQQQPHASSSRRPSDICHIHSNWGRDAFKCADPRTCRMRNVIKRRPQRQQAPAPGNAPAGGQN